MGTVNESSLTHSLTHSLTRESRLGETPLFIGVSHGHRYVVLLLLEYGADSAIGSSHGSVLDEAIRYVVTESLS